MMVLEELYRPLVFFDLIVRGKCPQISAFTGLGIQLSRIQPELSGFEPANHGILPFPRDSWIDHGHDDETNRLVVAPRNGLRFPSGFGFPETHRRMDSGRKILIPRFPPAGTIWTARLSHCLTGMMGLLSHEPKARLVKLQGACRCPSRGGPVIARPAWPFDDRGIAAIRARTAH